MATLNYCRICQKQRQGIGPRSQCESCGMPLTTTPAKVTVVTAKPNCPNCGSMSSKEIEEERFQCSACDAVFERCETNYVGHRPDRNAESREEWQIRQADRQRAGRRM